MARITGRDWIVLGSFCLTFFSCSQKADKPLEWTHYVRTSGHGCRIDQIHNIMEDARNTCLFGIEVDNDIPGRYNSLLNPDQKLEALKVMADSAHAGNNYAFVYVAGLECITDGVTPESGSFYRDHPEWVQRNRENAPAIFGGGAAFWIGNNDEDVWISPYVPEWRQLYMERIRQIAATGIDGVYVDIPYWMTHFDGWEDTWASFDTYTVREFKNRTGINAINDFKPGDWNDPEFIKWIDFRINTLTEFMAEIDKNVKSVNPECKTIAEIYPGIGEEAVRVGSDVYELYKVVDVIAHEYNVGNNSARREPAGWVEYMTGMFTFRAFAEGKPSWMLSYSWNGQENILPADAIENLAMSQVMAGTNPWDARRAVMSGSNDYEARTRVYKWIKKYEKLIYAPRKPIAPVGVYFSPGTRNYFSQQAVQAYLGIMNLLIQEKLEFEIITPRTLGKAKSDILILPDVKCVSDEEFGQFESWLKQGKTLISTGESGYYDDKRELSENRTRISDLSGKYPLAFYIEGTPETEYYQFIRKNYNQASYKDEKINYEKSQLKKILDHIHSGKYSPAVTISNAHFCVVQIASVDKKPTIFLANFSGLKGNENANQFPREDVVITFNKTGRNSEVEFIPFLGSVQKIKGDWNEGRLVVSLPAISRGAIIRLN
jgi:hypothetical protein